MRIFTKLRSFLMMESENAKKINEIEQGTNQLLKVVFERLDELEVNLPSHDKSRRLASKTKIKNSSSIFVRLGAPI